MKIKAVEMTRKIRDQIHEETKDMDIQARLEFYKKETLKFRLSHSKGQKMSK